MAAGDFALTGGVSQALGDLNTMSQTAMQNFNLQRAQQLLPFELEAAPVEIEGKRATTRLHQAQAGRQEEELRQDQALSRAMQQFSQGQSPGGITSDMPLSQQLTRLAELARKEGAGIRGMDLLGKATVAQGHEAQTKFNEIRAREQELGMITKAADFAARRIPFIMDDKGWNDLKLDYQKEFGQVPPWVQMPWSPQAAQMVRDYALSEKDKRTLELNTLKEDNQEYFRRTSAELTAYHRQAQIETEQRRKAEAEAKAKVGGKLPAPPTQQEVDNIKAKIDNDFKDLKIDGKDNLARVIAEEAKILSNAQKIPHYVAEERVYQKYKPIIGADPNSMANKIRGAFNMGPRDMKVGQGTRINPIKVGPGVTPKEGLHYVNEQGQVGIFENGQIRMLE